MSTKLHIIEKESVADNIPLDPYNYLYGGTDIAINGSFTTDAAFWDGGNAECTVSWDADRFMKLSTPSGSSVPSFGQSGNGFTVGKNYKVTFRAKSPSYAANITIISSYLSPSYTVEAPNVTTEWQDYEFYGVAARDYIFIHFGSMVSGQEIHIDNIRIELITWEGTMKLTSPVMPIDDYTLSTNFMGDNKISCTFSYPRKIDFNLREIVVYEREGDNLTEDFYLIAPPTWEKNEKSKMIEYTCEFVSKQDMLKSIPMTDTFEAIADSQSARRPALLQTQYSFFGGVYEYFMNIVSSMISEFGYYTDVHGKKQPNGWIFTLDLLAVGGYRQEGDDKEIVISDSNVFDALKDIYEKFKVPFFAHDNKILVGGHKLYVEHMFRYGQGNGLYKINKTPTKDAVITKIRGVGSERNIPYSYLQSEKNAAGLENTPMPRLMPKVFRDTMLQHISDPLKEIKDYYVDDASGNNQYNPLFPKVSYESFDDIYPTIKNVEYEGRRIDKLVGVYFDGTGVSAENATKVQDETETVIHPYFWLQIPKLDFDLNQHMNEKEKPVIEMTSGSCGGCKFEIVSVGNRVGSWKPYSKASSVNAFVWGELTMGSVMTRDESTSAASTFTTSELRASTILELYEKDKVTFAIQYDYAMSIYETAYIGEVRVGFTAALYSIADNGQTTFIKNIGTPNEISVTTATTSSGSLGFNEVYTIPDGTPAKKYFILMSTSVLYSKKANKGKGSKETAKVHYQRFPAGLASIVRSPRSSNNTMDGATWLYVKKDFETYNMLMPYVIEPLWATYDTPELWQAGKEAATSHNVPKGFVPVAEVTNNVGTVLSEGDEYIFTGISLPESYIEAAELKLEVELKKILSENSLPKYDYSCGFDEKFLAENPNIASQMVIGSTVLVYDQPDPSIPVDVEDAIEVVLNNITLKHVSDKKYSSQ